jgi:hypothetical protein
VVLVVVVPRIARVRRSEAIREGGHEVFLVRINLVVIVEDIGVAGPSRGLIVVAAASVHGAERSLRATEALFPLRSLQNAVRRSPRYFNQYSARLEAIGVRVASVVRDGVYRVVMLSGERRIRFGWEV